jgi:hypothetical protein
MNDHLTSAGADLSQEFTTLDDCIAEVLKRHIPDEHMAGRVVIGDHRSGREPRGIDTEVLVSMLEDRASARAQRPRIRARIPEGEFSLIHGSRL